MTPLEEAERKSRLWHILDACEQLSEFTGSRSAADYESDRMLRLAVERLFIIIGEAVSRLRAVDPEAAARIPDAAQIVAFRNQLVHNYPAINNDEVWAIIQHDLPLLLGEVRSLFSK